MAREEVRDRGERSRQCNGKGSTQVKDNGCRQGERSRGDEAMARGEGSMPGEARPRGKARSPG
jgi:hypothetical protein